jgi:hypothetical protein
MLERNLWNIYWVVAAFSIRRLCLILYTGKQFLEVVNDVPFETRIISVDHKNIPPQGAFSVLWQDALATINHKLQPQGQTRWSDFVLEWYCTTVTDLHRVITIASAANYFKESVPVITCCITLYKGKLVNTMYCLKILARWMCLEVTDNMTSTMKTIISKIFTPRAKANRRVVTELLVSGIVQLIEWTYLHGSDGTLSCAYRGAYLLRFCNLLLLFWN